MKKLYTVAILGATGAVGQEMMNILAERDFPVGKLIPLASARSAGKKLLFTWEAEVPLVCGDYAVIMATTQLRKDVLCIPKNALHRDTDGYFVYLMVDDKQVRTPVTPGLMSQASVEVVEGLKEGDVVYVQG